MLIHLHDWFPAGWPVIGGLVSYFNQHHAGNTDVFLCSLFLPFSVCIWCFVWLWTFSDFYVNAPKIAVRFDSLFECVAFCHNNVFIINEERSASVAERVQSIPRNCSIPKPSPAWNLCRMFLCLALHLYYCLSCLSYFLILSHPLFSLCATLCIYRLAIKLTEKLPLTADLLGVRNCGWDTDKVEEWDKKRGSWQYFLFAA